MLFSDMHPFVRYAQILTLHEKSRFDEVIPLDARLFFLQSGSGLFIIEGKEYHLRENDLLIINAGISYQICPIGKQASYLQVNFDYDMAASEHTAPVIPLKKKDFKREMLLSPIVFEDYPILSGVLFLKNMEILQKRLHSIISEFSLRLEFFKEKTSSLLSTCIIDAVRAYQTILTTGEDKVSAAVIAFIHENYAEPLTNASIGAHFNYHPNYISHLVKASTGLSLHQYLIHVRLTKAVSLLQNTSLPISEVASACGFCDLAYFSGCFKRTFKVNPSKFRNA